MAESKRVRFTVHAVERFIERCAPSTSIVDATAILKLAVASAVQVEFCHGAEIWSAPDYRCRLVLRRSPTAVRCVTVLDEAEEIPQGRDRGALASAYHYINDRAKRGDPSAVTVLRRLHAEGYNYGKEAA